MRTSLFFGLAASVFVCLCGDGWGQAGDILVPQRGAFSSSAAGALAVASVEVGVLVEDRVATTTMDIVVDNLTDLQRESELLVPLPEGAIVRDFSFHGDSAEPTAEILPVDLARSTYRDIVYRLRDPALLEFAGYSVVQSSVFPVAPHGQQKIRLTYEHVLTGTADRVDYLLPRSEMLAAGVEWRLHMKIRATRPIAGLFSPSHRFDWVRVSDREVALEIIPKEAREPGSFRVSALLEQEGLSVSMVTYPDPETGGGYFMLMAALPVAIARTDDARIRRELTLVMDCSGSMQGEKLHQVREAARDIIGGLEDGERFNLVTYNQTVTHMSSAPAPKDGDSARKASEFLDAADAHGGTNIHDALAEALRMKPLEGTLPILFFLTDGVPTTGVLSESTIRALTRSANPHEWRAFSIGVGEDVNAPLLQAIATNARGSAEFVLPGEDARPKLERIFRRLEGPILAAPDVVALDASGKEDRARLRDVMPPVLPDLFDGDQLVLLGRYVGQEPLRLQIGGNYLGRRREFEFGCQVASAGVTDAFVPRIWAGRQVAHLIDAIRSLGSSSGDVAGDDPRLRELVDEVVRLSRNHGVLTEYTAFFASDGVDLRNRADITAQAEDAFRRRAFGARTGDAGLSQDINIRQQRGREFLNHRNQYYDDRLYRVEFDNVQQVSDLTFFRRGDVWVDSRLLDRWPAGKPDVIAFGSKEHEALIDRLFREGRPGSLALDGDILLAIDGKAVRIESPRPAEVAIGSPPPHSAPPP
ncbi:MAG: VWA domain-containing protein [Planctomycetes bacterium]|nr:VWA domain-containing protein [Planctomycetota bacterium]